jgi:hypothetical protein
VLIAAAVGGTLLYRTNTDHRSARLTVTWDGREGHPSCRYDPKAATVTARIAIDGRAKGHDSVTVTVTAYADENTSQPVGSSSRRANLHGTVHRHLVIGIPVDKPPHLDDDGITACRLAVTY